MLYLKHHFAGNIMSADGTGDPEMKRDIIISELAKLIAVKPDVVITYLRAAGVKVSDNASSNQLVKLVADTVPKSAQFTALIAEEMIGRGRASRVMNGDGDAGTTGSGNGWSNVDWAAMSQSTLSLINSMKDLFGKDKPKSQQQLQQNTNAVNQIAGNGWSTETKVLIGFAIGIPLLIGGFFAVKAITK